MLNPLCQFPLCQFPFHEGRDHTILGTPLGGAWVSVGATLNNGVHEQPALPGGYTDIAPFCDICIWRWFACSQCRSRGCREGGPLHHSVVICEWDRCTVQLNAASATAGVGRERRWEQTQPFNSPTLLFPSLDIFGGGVLPGAHTPQSFSAFADTHLVLS